MQAISGTAAGIDELFTTLARFLGGYGGGSAPNFTGTGNGVIPYLEATPDTVAENWTLTATSATTFSVTGSVSGAQTALNTSEYYSNDYFSAVIKNGTTPFSIGDQFTFSTTAGLMDASERWEVLRWHGVEAVDASSYVVEFEPENTIKGPYHTFQDTAEDDWGWKTAIGQTAPCWLSYKFTHPIEVTTLRLTGPDEEGNVNPATGYPTGPKDFSLQWSDDGVDWVTLQSWTGITDWTGVGGGFSTDYVPTPKIFPITATPVGKKQYWRLYITANNGSANYTELTRFEVLTYEVFTYYNWATRPIACLKAPGMTGLDSVYINFQLYDRPTADIYNIALTIATGFTAVSTFDDHPGAHAAMAIPSWDQATPYWFNANGQRVTIGIKVASSYFSAYAGKILTFGLPTQFPYPVVLAAPLATASLTKYTDTTLVKMPYKGNLDHMKLREIDGVWVKPYAWPYSLNLPFKDTGGEYPLMPIVLYSGTVDNTYGTLDGINHISGFNNAPENTVTVGAEEHVCFPSGTSTGVNDYHTLRTA